MVNSGLYTSNSDEWATPQLFFNELDREFNFELDVCATDQNAKCTRYFTREQDGLSQDWGRLKVWCNPPYGKGIDRWISKCIKHAERGSLAVMLIPARTDTRWFHDLIYHNPLAEIRFVRGRLRFITENSTNWNAPFPSMIVVFSQ